jgi:hypothetical protein
MTFLKGSRVLGGSHNLKNLTNSYRRAASVGQEVFGPTEFIFEVEIYSQPLEKSLRSWTESWLQK